MRIILLKKSDNEIFQSLVLIHQKVLTESVLSRFGNRFLLILYRTIYSDSNVYIHLVLLKRKIIGFSVVTTDISLFYKKIFLSGFVNLSWEAIKHLNGNMRLIFNVLLWIISKKKDNHQSSELQFLAILPEYQGHGLGTRLIKTLKEELRKKNVPAFKVGTKATNVTANNFYIKKGFKFLYQQNIFGDKFNYYISKTSA